jgi:hypothetical protein
MVPIVYKENHSGGQMRRDGDAPVYRFTANVVSWLPFGNKSIYKSVVRQWKLAHPD